MHAESVVNEQLQTLRMHPFLGFLRSCVARRTSSLASSGAFNLSDVENWEALVQWAGRHGVLPIVTPALLQASVLPGELRRKVLLRHREHGKRSLHTVAVLIEIQQRYERVGVQAVCWKGPALAKNLYGSFVDREFSDLDFLISPQQLSMAAQILTELGFKRHDKTENSKFNDRIAGLDCDKSFFRPTDGVYVELHIEIMPARFSAWRNKRPYAERAVSFALPGTVEALQLSPEDLLTSLCAHGIKHNWEHLKWVVDIALFIEVYRDLLDWGAVADRAEDAGKLAPLMHGLQLACGIFSPELPPALGNMSSSQVTEVSRAAISSLSETAELSLDHEMSHSLLNLLCPSRVSRFCFTVGRAFEPRLIDFRDSRHPLLAKWRRLLWNSNPNDTLHKTVSALRRIW